MVVLTHLFPELCYATYHFPLIPCSDPQATFFFQMVDLSVDLSAASASEDDM